MSSIVVGIDPGQTGGAVALNSFGEFVSLKIMPEDMSDLAHWLMVHQPTLVGIEKVAAMPKQGVASTFKFGLNTGTVHGIVMALGLPYILVTPQRWQKSMHIGVSGDDPKIRSRHAAARLFPGVDLKSSSRAKYPHAGLVDAILIADWARRHQSPEASEPRGTGCLRAVSLD